MDLLQALSELPQLIADYRDAKAELIEAKRELSKLQDDGYVTWEWVCRYFGVTLPTAKAMLADEKILVHRKQIKRLRKSDVLRYAEKHSVLVKHVPA